MIMRPSTTCRLLICVFSHFGQRSLCLMRTSPGLGGFSGAIVRLLFWESYSIVMSERMCLAPAACSSLGTELWMGHNGRCELLSLQRGGDSLELCHEALLNSSGYTARAQDGQMQCVKSASECLRT